MGMSDCVDKKTNAHTHIVDVLQIPISISHTANKLERTRRRFLVMIGLELANVYTPHKRRYTIYYHVHFINIIVDYFKATWACKQIDSLFTPCWLYTSILFGTHNELQEQIKKCE